VFQNTVLTFLVSLKATTEDLKNLNQLFLTLDTSHDGQLSYAELQDGMELIMEQLGRNGKQKGNLD
jgi:Ca2+-binding EF-hand superfamily protein